MTRKQEVHPEACGDDHEVGSRMDDCFCCVATALHNAGAIRAALEAVKSRLHFIGMPNEPTWEGRPDWRKEIALIEDALADAVEGEAV